MQPSSRFFAFSVVALALSGACAGSAEPLAENRACFRALDCQEGLVCVQGRCTADIAPIVPEGAGTGVMAEPSPAPAEEADPEQE